jgi:hypothetical protein
LPELYPQGDLPQGWGLTFFLHQHAGPTGRSGSTGWFVPFPVISLRAMCLFLEYYFLLERLLGGNETHESADGYRRNE